MNSWEFVLRFAEQSPFTTFIIVCCIYYAWKAPFICIKRAIRSRDIQRHGWPTQAHMDADGDFNYPDKDKK